MKYPFTCFWIGQLESTPIAEMSAVRITMVIDRPSTPRKYSMFSEPKLPRSRLIHGRRSMNWNEPSGAPPAAAVIPGSAASYPCQIRTASTHWATAASSDTILIICFCDEGTARITRPAMIGRKTMRLSMFRIGRFSIEK